MAKKQSLKAKKIKKIIILLFVFLLALLIGVVVVYNNPTDKKIRYIYNTEKVGTIDIMPTNVDKLFVNYKGKVPSRSVYKAMDVFVNQLVPKYVLATKNLSKDKISNYFKENHRNIEKELGITEEEKFVSFCDNLNKNLKNNELTLSSYTINPNSVKKFSARTEYVIIVKYNDNQKIAFKLSLQNKVKEEKTPIYYEACTDEIMLEYEYIPNEYETPEEIKPTGRVVE